MKIKVSDYIADFFAENGIRTIFTVVGGGAMHMNDSFGHHERLTCVYNHHEQASSIAAECYYRVNNEMAGVCVTSGPGAINALNGVAGAYQDSIPMIVVSGQTKTSLTVRSSGLELRTMGNQEFDIVSALSNMTKYSETIMDAGKIRYCLEKAFFLAKNGRPGPCWLDVPLDIQGAYIVPDELPGYNFLAEDLADKTISKQFNGRKLDTFILEIVGKVNNAKRPIIYAGNGIRLAGAVPQFHKLINLLQIPVVTCWNSIDLMETDDPLYAGRAGIMGNRSGNFAVQNSDLLICIGSRLNVYQVGYQIDSWARDAYVIMVDIDSEELKKPTIRVDMPICCDAKEFIDRLIDKYKLINHESVMIKPYQKIGEKGLAWKEQCRKWLMKYPVVEEKHYMEKEEVNVYAFFDCLSRKLEQNSITVVANGSASVVGSASFYIGSGFRFLMNCGLSSMGYDLPAAIGAASAAKREVLCIAGDGSIMMNLQELQTIRTNNLPIKIVIINNNGYQQIRITQTNLFQKHFVGVGPDSGDLSFPNFEKIAYAFDIPYYSCKRQVKMHTEIEKLLKHDGCAILEVFCSITQFFEPKSATKRLENGELYSPPLEDMAPFLERKELEENMYIPLMEEK